MRLMSKASPHRAPFGPPHGTRPPIHPAEQQTPRGLAPLHKSETQKWVPVIKVANIKAN
jgi:hypothetical protein